MSPQRRLNTGRALLLTAVAAASLLAPATAANASTAPPADPVIPSDLVTPSDAALSPHAAVSPYPVTSSDVVVPPDAVVSPDGRRAAWVVDGHNVWGATRANSNVPWRDLHRDLTIRGTVEDLSFSPDNGQLVFENPRDTHGFIAVFDFGKRRILYVDPVFATDTDPTWTGDGESIAFTRKVTGVPDTHLTKPVPSLDAWQPPEPREGDKYPFADLLATPIAYQPEASGDGRAVAYITWESTRRAINVMRVGEKAVRVADYPEDDGIELSQVNVSKTGGAVTYVRGSAPNDKGETLNPKSDPDPPSRQVWIVPSESGADPILLGEGHQPRFSPGDERVVWVSGQNVMTAPLTWKKDGLLHKVGAPSVLFAFEGSVSTLRFSPDGGKLAYQRGSGVEIYDVESRATWVSPRAGGSDAAPSWSPDGKSVAYRHNVSGRPWSIWVADVAARRTRQIWQAGTGAGSAFYGFDQNPTFQAQPGDQLLWSADGQIAFPWERNGWRHIYAVPSSGNGAARLLTPGEGEVESVSIIRDRTRLIYSTNIGDTGRRHLTGVDFSGGAPAELTGGRTSQWAPTPLADGGLAYVDAGWDDPPAIRIRDGEGRTTRASLPELPGSFPAKHLLEPQLVEFPATDGKKAYGQLFAPDDPTGCSVIFPHGGPRRAMLPGFHYYDTYSVLYELNQYLASHGCVVLSVDYRGGIMHGHDFRNAPGRGGTSASEYRDILGGVDFLRARPDVDPGEMAIHGLSWGGYIASLAVARNSDIFKVSLDVAGVHDAAIAEIDGLRSPIMVLHGDDDRNVDFKDSVDLAQALATRRPGTKLVQRAYPNEMHEIYMTYEHLVDTYNGGAQFLLDHLPQAGS